MPALFAVAASLVLISPSPAPVQPTPAQKEAFLRVLRRAPAFAEGTARELGTVRLGMPMQGTDGKGWVVKFTANVFAESIESIWTGATVRRRREDMLKGQLLDVCSKCMGIS